MPTATVTATVAVAASVINRVREKGQLRGEIEEVAKPAVRHVLSRVRLTQQ